MNKKVLLFTGEHCVGCKPMKEKLSKILPDFPHIGYDEINVEDEANESWLAKYQVRSVPSLILLYKDSIKNVIIGNVNEAKIRKALGEL